MLNQNEGGNVKKKGIWNTRYWRAKMKESDERNLKENGERKSHNDCSEKMKRSTESILRHVRKL